MWRALDYILSQQEPVSRRRGQELRIESLFPMDGRPAPCCALGQAAEADAFLTERGRVLDSSRPGNYNHGARAGRVFPAGRRVPR